MEFGTPKKLDILLISSSTPTGNSARMAVDMVKALESTGHHVQLLLKYPVKIDSVKAIAVYSKIDLFKQRISNVINTRISRLVAFFLPKRKQPESKYLFFTENEDKPPVRSTLILKKIPAKYDLVLIFFWQEMLSSKSILDIYNKLKVPIFLISADMFPMTGGCSYFWDCRNFENSCGKCPAISSEYENDLTNKVFLYKKNVYDNANCVFLGNTWMNNHVIKSKLFKNVGTIFPVIDETLFRPHDKEVLKEQFGLKDKVILFTGAMYVNEERKGFKYLVESLQLLSTNIAGHLRNKIILVVAGDVDIDLRSYFNFETLKTGYLSYETLALYYAMSDVYLSPTIQDAGPMMVNQALMCGTPVVAFDIGTARDVVNDSTGYKANYKDAKDFCRGIMHLLELGKDQKESMWKQCRQMSFSKSSYNAFEKQIVKVYNDLKVTSNADKNF